ncbi:MAG: hypothetical protein PWP39_296 [Pyrococcus sp.]|nr:hypothetical protein [Pyrococcus sp.]
MFSLSHPFIELIYLFIAERFKVFSAQHDGIITNLWYSQKTIPSRLRECYRIHRQICWPNRVTHPVAKKIQKNDLLKDNRFSKGKCKVFKRFLKVILTWCPLYLHHVVFLNIPKALLYLEIQDQALYRFSRYQKESELQLKP